MKRTDRDIYSSTQRERRARGRGRSQRQMILIAVAVGLIGVAVVALLVFGVMKLRPAEETASSGTSQSAPSGEDPGQTIPAESDSSREESSQGAEQASSSAASQSSSSSGDAGGHVEQIDGQNVYVDTKHPAPEKTGTALVVTATGETSYGFDWDYSTDNKNFQLSCNYVFDTKTYQFSIYGVAPGTSHIDLVYYTADDKKETMPLTIQVDDQLNVSRVS